MVSAVKRLLRVAFQPRESARRAPKLKDLAAMRQHLLRTIDDCTGQPAHRLRQQIEAATTAQELWLLRNDAFQLISQRHSQPVAAQRIDSLIRVFEGWVDPKHLARVR